MQSLSEVYHHAIQIKELKPSEDYLSESMSDTISQQGDFLGNPYYKDDFRHIFSVNGSRQNFGWDILGNHPKIAEFDSMIADYLCPIMDDMATVTRVYNAKSKDDHGVTMNEVIRNKAIDYIRVGQLWLKELSAVDTHLNGNWETLDSRLNNEKYRQMCNINFIIGATWTR